MRDRVKIYECEECGIVVGVEKEYVDDVDDGYGGEELVVRCNYCGRVISE